LNKPQSLEKWKGAFARNGPKLRNFSQNELKLVDAFLQEGGHVFFSCCKAVM
jgi:hypothetical protein